MHNGIFLFVSWINSTSPSFRYWQSREIAMETSVSNDAAGLSRRSNAKSSDTFSSLDRNRSSTNDGDIQVSLAIKKNKWKKMTYRDWHDHFRRRSLRNPICRSRQRYDDDEGETSVTPNCESEANIYNRSKSLARFQQRFFGDKRSSGCGDFILSFAAGPSFVTRLKDIDTRSILSHCCREHITLRFMASFLLPLRNRKSITACSITSAHRTRQFMNAHFRWKISDAISVNSFFVVTNTEYSLRHNWKVQVIRTGNNRFQSICILVYTVSNKLKSVPCFYNVQLFTGFTLVL